MITSMTGFGRSEASSDGLSVTVELKTVNGRYLDFSMRLPTILQDKELALKELLQEHIQRGKVNFAIHIDKSDTGEPEVIFNKKLVQAYTKMLADVRKTANIHEPLSLDTLLGFENLFEPREEDQKTRNTIWELTRESTRAAIKNLKKMRLQEGTQLENDLHERVDHIEKMLGIVKKKTEGRAELTKKHLLERINSLIDSDKIDDDRLEMEVALLVDKMDITEEIIRTQSHIKFFREAVHNEDSVGRRLKFLSQEINREINTIGSKANDSEISQYVVQAKESLEQIREQVQNIE